MCELKFKYLWRESDKGGVTPSRVCELKSFKSLVSEYSALVTPSRVCELKYRIIDELGKEYRHTLTGV